MADEKEFDPFHFSTGLPEKFRGTVVDSHFGFDSEYNDGKTCLLVLEIQTDDAEIGEAGRTKVLYPCGNGWEPADRGAKLIREDGKDPLKRPVNAQSGLATLVRSAFEAGGEEVLRGRGTPYDSGIWSGLTFDWERKEFSFEQGGEKRTYNRMLITGFVQDGATTTAPTAAPAAQAAPAAADGGTTRVSVSANGLTPVLRAKLKKVAADVKAAGGTHDQFIEQAFDKVPEVMETPAAEAALMETDAGSIWAEA